MNSQILQPKFRPESISSDFEGLFVFVFDSPRRKNLDAVASSHVYAREFYNWIKKDTRTARHSEHSCIHPVLSYTASRYAQDVRCTTNVPFSVQRYLGQGDPLARPRCIPPVIYWRRSGIEPSWASRPFRRSSCVRVLAPDARQSEERSCSSDTSMTGGAFGPLFDPTDQWRAALETSISRDQPSRIECARA